MRALLVLSSATVLGGLALAVPALGEANQLQFPQMLPGQYEETIQFVSHSDNAPPELVARFDDKKPFVRKFCYKRDVQDPLSPSLIQFRAGRDCAPVSATVDGAGAGKKHPPIANHQPKPVPLLKMLTQPRKKPRLQRPDLRLVHRKTRLQLRQPIPRRIPSVS